MKRRKKKKPKALETGSDKVGIKFSFNFASD